MEIEKTIIKWFEDTFHRMEKEFKPVTRVDEFCMAVIMMSKNYCGAALLLINNGHKMPAKALLRVLCELTVKFAWCLRVPDEIDKDENDIVYQNIRRWAKATFLQKVKNLESFREAARGTFEKELEDMIKTAKEDAQRIRLKAMPNVPQICESLPEGFKSRAYPELYLQFNNAVHLDVKSIGDLIEREGGTTLCSPDCKDSAENLEKYCMRFAYMLNALVRMHYNWATHQMTEEYELAK